MRQNPGFSRIAIHAGKGTAIGAALDLLSGLMPLKGVFIGPIVGAVLGAVIGTIWELRGICDG